MIGVGLGVIVGCACAMWRLGDDLLDPVIQMFRTVPFVALTSLFVVWFGIGERPKYLLVALGCFFPVYLNTFNGIRNVDARLVETAQGFGLSRLGLVREVILPGALPQALLGLRYALGISWLALVIAEQINANSGIGYLLSTAQNNLDTPGIIASVCHVRRPRHPHRHARPTTRGPAAHLATDLHRRMTDIRVDETGETGPSLRRNRDGSQPASLVWLPGRPPRSRSRCCARRGGGPARVERLRQDDPSPGARRPRSRGHRPRRGARGPRRCVPGAPPPPMAPGLAEREHRPAPVTGATGGRAALEEVGLAGRADAWPNTLSGGEGGSRRAGPGAGPPAPSSCCSTSRLRPWTPSLGSRCTPWCASCGNVTIQR